MFRSFDPGRLTNVYEGTGTSTLLDQFAYNDDGTLASRTEGSGASSAAYTWDAIGRLTGQADVIGTAANVSWTFSINPASQITSDARTETSNAYAYTGLVAVNRNYAVNGLNQYTTAGPASFTYDGNGNLTADGSNTFTYDIENRLVKAVAGSVTTNLLYDPLGRLFQTDKGTTATTTKFLYDGDALVSEFGSTNAMTARYVHGSNAAADDPLVWYTGTGSTTKRWLHADHLGSVVAVTSNTGTSFSKNAYDEYGMPGSANVGRFQYTGQAWIPELGMYYYKARIYSATLGRFLQTDPIGYKDQYNLYAYAGNDPVNRNDPSGTYGMGSGWDDPEKWKKFDSAQKATAKDMEKRADKLDAKAARLDAKPNRSGDGLRQRAASLRGGASALRSDGSDGKLANAVSAAQYKAMGGSETGAAMVQSNNTNVMTVNLGNPELFASTSNMGVSQLQWVVGHESLHTVGLTDQKGPNGFYGYRYSNDTRERAAFDALTGTPAANTNPDHIMSDVYP